MIDANVLIIPYDMVYIFDKEIKKIGMYNGNKQVIVFKQTNQPTGVTNSLLDQHISEFIREYKHMLIVRSCKPLDHQ
jgi:hypothetical protein